MLTPPDRQARACVVCDKEKFTKLSWFRDAAGWCTFPTENGQLVVTVSNVPILSATGMHAKSKKLHLHERSRLDTPQAGSFSAPNALASRGASLESMEEITRHRS